MITRTSPTQPEDTFLPLHATGAQAHREAIARLGFVHEWLPASSRYVGSWFTSEADWHEASRSPKRTTPSIRVCIDDDSTSLNVFDGHELLWYAEFSPETPGNVLNQAVAAARQSQKANA